LARTAIHSKYDIVGPPTVTPFNLYVCTTGKRCKANPVASIVDRRFARGLQPKRGALDGDKIASNAQGGVASAVKGQCAPESLCAPSKRDEARQQQGR
jgi:hypothetical protein